LSSILPESSSQESSRSTAPCARFAAHFSVALLAREKKFTELFIPIENADEAGLVSGITIYPVRTLSDILAHLTKRTISR